MTFFRRKPGNDLLYRLWNSQSSSAVTLLLYADLMMLKIATNQGEANSVSVTPSQGIPAVGALFFSTYVSFPVFYANM